MNEPTPPVTPTKSPFAHRASRVETLAAEPTPAKPKTRTKPSGGLLPKIAGAGALVAIVGIGVWVFSGDKTPTVMKPAAAAPAGSPKETPAERAKHAQERFVAALALARQYGCAKTAPAENARILLAESDAEAAMKAGKIGVAAVSWETGATLAERFAAAEAKKTYASALAAISPTDFTDYAGDKRTAVEALVARAESEFSANRQAEAALAYGAATDAIPGLVSAARTRLASLAAAAESGGETASATLLRRKLVALNPADRESSDWLMKKGVVCGTQTRTPKIGVALAYLTPGEYTQGSPEGEPSRESDETRRTVTLTRGFWMGVTEVTQGQWDAVMGKGAAAAKLSREKAAFLGPDMPMVDISWKEADEFCRRLSSLEGMRFRLPTEAEWEFAARAGSDAPYPNGRNFLNPGEAVVDDGTVSAPASPRAVTAPDAPANSLGLRDMQGNVWEWCSDWYAARTAAATTDPTGPADNAVGRADLAMKTLRGGSWNDPAAAARNANRWQYSPSVAVNYIGFRVLLEFSPEFPSTRP